MAGSTVYVDLHVEICSDLSFREAHRLVEEIEEEITRRLEVSDVITHIDPCMEECDECEVKVN